MGKIIAVYTATGNSLYAARKIEGYRPILIEKILSGEETIPDDTESLGFAFPVYCWGVPYPMRRFIREYMAGRDNSGLKYVFAIATSASTPLSTLADMERELADIGIALAYSASVRMPDAYLPLQKKAVTDEKAREIVRKADADLAAISSAIADESVSIPKRGPLYHVMRRISPYAIKPEKTKLRASDRCIGCSLCERLCPMGNISVKDGKAIFGDRCISCFACYHRCPESAIEYPGAIGQYHGIVPTEDLIRR